MKITGSAMVLICLLFSGCVSLKTPKRANLVPLKEPKLIGKYPARIYKEASYTKKTYPFVLWYLFKSSPGTDSIELNQATHMELELTDDKHVSSRLYKNDILLKSDVIKGRLKNGYFRKKGSNSMTGVPPFYWSMSSDKMQFGIGPEQQLFIDHASVTNGGLLIMMAGTPGSTISDTIPQYVKP